MKPEKYVMMMEWKCGHQWAEVALYDSESEQPPRVVDGETVAVRLTVVRDMTCHTCRLEQRIRDRHAKRVCD